MNNETFIAFTVLAKKKFPDRLNPRFTEKEKKLIKDTVNKSGHFLPLFKTLPKQTRLKIYLIRGVEKPGRKIYIKNAIDDYAKSYYCLVCGNEKSSIINDCCSTACGNKLKNGSFLKPEEVQNAINKHGENPKFTEKEIKQLKCITKTVTQYNVHGLRNKIFETNKTLDEKLIAITHNTTTNYRERTYIAENNYPRNTCKNCGKPVKFTTTLNYPETCSYKCMGKNEDTKEKRKHTMIKKYGGSSCLNSSLAIKVRKTIKERYGVSNVSQMTSVKEKKTATLMKNYGVTNPSKSKKIQKRKINTNIERYGCINPMHNINIAQKCITNAFNYKEFNLCGRSVLLQGYEKQALDYLFRSGKVRKQEVSVQSDLTVPYFEYTVGNKTKVYYPDFYIKRLNRVIEVKSTYTIATSENNWKTNKQKFKAVLDAGYNLTVLVMHEKVKIPLPSNWMSMSYNQIKKYMTYHNVKKILKAQA